MPSRRLTPVALAAALIGLPAFAQQANVPKPSAELDKVVVTGIRATLERSLIDKRNAGANVDVITALEVGKMPDKNLADSLQRVPGVAVRTDYDEAE
jgi:iron complex outermembrane receptor protein